MNIDPSCNALATQCVEKALQQAGLEKAGVRWISS